MKIGRIQIDRVADLENVRVPTSRGFPHLTREMLQRYAAEFGPEHIDPVSLDLIMSFHTLVLRVDGKIILIDTCIGNDKNRPNHTVLGWSHRRGDFLRKLAATGVAPEKVDVVMCTHLHADHVGWNTKLVNGRWVPTFPNARYIMAEAEYRHWLDQHRLGAGLSLKNVTAGSAVVHGAFADSVLPVAESGQAELVSSTFELQTGIYMEPAPGHTLGHVMIHIEDGTDRGVCTGDLIHHPFQFSCPDAATAYCELPELACQTRVAFCARFADTNTLIMPAHFSAPSAGRIKRDGKLFRFEFERT
ncbi:MAG: MBL fold metallo-hydrolase [Hyphomicrobiales bacterium]|nr:MBL fold metallo-hydrolase [Hyphomicrobiales bacterium]